jgi:hypothetical protein
MLAEQCCPEGHSLSAPAALQNAVELQVLWQLTITLALGPPMAQQTPPGQSLGAAHMRATFTASAQVLPMPSQAPSWC